MTFLFFFFNDTATTEIYTLSLHDALPISWPIVVHQLCRDDEQQRAVREARETRVEQVGQPGGKGCVRSKPGLDRKSTRLNSSHGYISYAVFCLKKKKRSEAHSRRAKWLPI